MTTEIKVRKRYISLLTICLIIFAINLFFSSSSQTNIIQHNETKKANLTKQDIAELIIEESEKDRQKTINKPDFIIKKGSINSKPMYCELRDHNIDSIEILQLAKDFKDVFDFKRSRKGDEYTLFFSKEHQLKKIEYKRDILTQYVAKKNESNGFDVVKSKIVLNKQVVVKEFLLKSSLFQAILDGQEGYSLAFDLTEIFSWDIDFFLYPIKGDRIQIEFEKLTLDNKFVKYGKILAARYIAKEKTFSAFLFNDGKHNNYYDEKGSPMKKMFLRVPIKSARITSSFSLRRFHPVLKKWRRHTGIDYGSRYGTAIFATANGRVRFAGWSNGYGKLVIVVHPNGYETYYGHCSKLLVKPGNLVDQGELIAKVGSTGHATGPHVHYEVRINRKPVNPNMLKSSPGKPLAEEFLSEYQSLVNKRLGVLESIVEVAASKDLTRERT